MNSRRLVMLLTALVVLVALAVAVSVSQRPVDGSGQLLLPDLKARLNDIDKIVVRTGGNKTIATLARQKDGWVLVERGNYPADVGKIRKDLIALAEAKVLEEKTSNPEFYSKLGVDDVAKETAGGVQLDLVAGNKATSVIVGNTGVGGGERAYARRAGEPKSWLVGGNFEVPRETAEWLDRGLTNIAPLRVHAVTITRPDGPAVRLEKPSRDAGDFTVLDVPAGRTLSFPGVGNPIGSALSDLTLETVDPASGFAPGDVKPTVARFETFDGLVVEASTYKLPAGARVRFDASADQALAERFAPKPVGGAQAPKDDKATSPPAEAEKQKSFDDVKAEAAQLNARVGNWVYSLPDFKGEQLTKKMEDLLQPLPTKTPAPKKPAPRPTPALPQSPAPG